MAILRQYYEYVFAGSEVSLAGGDRVCFSFILSIIAGIVVIDIAFDSAA